jgi:hypothetical protein
VQGGVNIAAVEVILRVYAIGEVGGQELAVGKLPSAGKVGFFIKASSRGYEQGKRCAKDEGNY